MRKGAQGLDTIRRGATGRDLVAFQLRSLLKSDWQNIDAENDDAIDGAVLLRHRGKFLGRMLFVQVKSGPSFKLNYQQARFQGMIGVKLGKEYIATHRPRWDALPGPVILAYVEDPDDRKSKIYWQALKSAEFYSKTNKAVVLVTKFHTFGNESQGALRRLAASVPIRVPLP